MTNYTVNCILVVTDIIKGEEIYAFLQEHYTNNIDLARGKCWLQDRIINEDYSVKFIGFWATFKSELERDLVYNTINSYKQYCLMGNNVEYQIIQKLDTDSPTFGSPISNIIKEEWGMMC
jgi:hypothetical protein